MVSDRFLDSSLAYQGGARGLGVDEVERDQPLRDRRPGARPHLPARDRPGRRGRARGRERPLRGRGRRAAAGGARGLRAAGRGRPGPLAADRRRRARPTRCTPRCWPRSRPPAAGRARERRRWPAPRTTRRRGWCWPRRWPGEPSHAYLFHGPAGHRQAHRRAGVRRRAAGRGRSPTRTRCACACMHGTHPDLTWVRPTGAHVMRVEDVDEAGGGGGHPHAVRGDAGACSCWSASTR